MIRQYSEFPDKQKLKSILKNSFNLGELISLCFDLGIRYEDIPGETLDRKAIELIEYFDRRGTLYQLFNEIKEQRPERFQEILEDLVYAKRLVLSITTPKVVISLSVDISDISTQVEELFINGLLCQLCSFADIPQESISVFDRQQVENSLHLTLQAPRKDASRLVATIQENHLNFKEKLPGLQLVRSEITDIHIFEEVSTSFFAQHFLRIYERRLNSSSQKSYRSESVNLSVQKTANPLDTHTQFRQPTSQTQKIKPKMREVQEQKQTTLKNKHRSRY